MFKFRFGKKSPKGQSGYIDFEESKDTLESNLVQPSNSKSDDIKLKRNSQSEARKDDKEKKKDGTQYKESNEYMQS